MDDSDFVDSDYEEARRQTAVAAPKAEAASTGPARPPSREEIEDRVESTRKRIAELKSAQERLQRDNAVLEDQRRRQSEYDHGKREMLGNLTRGVALLEDAEFNARRDAEQMAKALVELREALTKVEAIRDKDWTSENWESEMTKALAILESSRMEWNSARLKFSILSEPAADEKEEPMFPKLKPGIPWYNMSFKQLSRLGFALTWPVAVAIGLVMFLVGLLT